MPRANTGPRLAFYQPRNYTAPLYFIRWYERGSKCERATGTDDRAKAEKALAEFINSRPTRAEDGPRDPHELGIAQVLALYGEEHAPRTADPARIGYAIDALLPFWGDRMVSAIKGETCRAYVKKRGVSDGTTRRELGTLRAALRYCVNEGYLTHAPGVVLPERPPSRERWLTRSEAGALLRAARSEPRSRFHLPLFILIGLYTGARKEAILALQWQPNTEGGWIDLGRGLIDFNATGRRQTKKRRPLIPIPPRLLRFLRYARRRTRQYVIEWLGAGVADIRKGFGAACATARLEGVSPHILRHTCATWLMQRGVSTRDAADFLGMSEETIKRVYYHAHPRYMMAAVNALR